MVMPFGLPRPLDAIGTVAAIGTGIVSTTIHDAVETVETVAAVGTGIVSTTVHDTVDAVETVTAIGTAIASTTVHDAVDLGAQLATLPYMGKRNLPTTYHDVLEYSVEGYKQMRHLLDWFFDIAEFQPSSPPVNTVGDLVTTAVNEANLAIKRVRYTWAHNGDFPPHLLIVPVGQFAHDSIHLFKFTRLFDTVKTLFPFIPDFDFFKSMAPPSFANMQYLFTRNKLLHYSPFKPLGGNMYTAENVGLREDWFTDAVFAQQQFTGPETKGIIPPPSSSPAQLTSSTFKTAATLGKRRA
ncbi:hypothetical protein NLJ89_g11722 [Agrocybe chaxingu]|uniref:Uncharacterized protein n=1 Tax=Agrocybe chaxingu TaxID=84603 RepID=A0A9W8JLE0_9AGAR|nr:hypothetical protein NLJ89_g11722 [Agrocybe chaxingu]